MADRRAIGALLAVQVLFAMWPVAAKEVFPFLPPIQLMAVRVVGAAVLLALAVRALHGRRQATPLPWRGMLGFLALLSLLGVVVNQSLFVLGLERTSPVNATILITTIPVFTYALAVALGRESLGPRRLAGIALAMGGALYLVGLSRFQAGWYTALGDLMIIANAFSFSAYLVLSKPLNERYDPLQVTLWTFLLAAVVFVPVGLLSGAPGAVRALEQATLGWLAFIILGPSVLTYLLNAIALRSVPASTVAVFIYLQPILTAVFAWWVQGDVPSWQLLPAAALVFAGVWLVARRSPAHLQSGDVAME